MAPMGCYDIFLLMHVKNSHTALKWLFGFRIRGIQLARVYRSLGLLLLHLSEGLGEDLVWALIRVVDACGPFCSGIMLVLLWWQISPYMLVMNAIRTYIHTGIAFHPPLPHPSSLGCAMSGLIADSRTMVDRARVDAQNHWFVYNEPMSVESVTQSVSNLAMMFGEDDDEKPMVRGCVI